MSKDLVHWPSLAADGFPFPDGVPPARLGDEPSAMLVSADPQVRDERACTAAHVAAILRLPCPWLA